MSGRAKRNNSAKTTMVRIVCLVLAALMIFSVVISAIWY